MKKLLLLCLALLMLAGGCFRMDIDVGDVDDDDRDRSLRRAPAEPVVAVPRLAEAPQATPPGPRSASR